MRAPSGLAALEPGREAVETAARVRAGAEGREVPEAVGRDDEAGVVTAGGRVARSQHRSAVGRDSACIAGVVVDDETQRRRCCFQLFISLALGRHVSAVVCNIRCVPNRSPRGIV